MVVLGFLVERGFIWAFIAAISLLTVDSIMVYILPTLAGVWPFVLHGLAIYCLVLGLKGAKIHNLRKKNGQV